MKQSALIHILVSAALTAFISCSLLPGPAEAAKPDDTPQADAIISVSAIPGVVAPVRGAAPVTAPVESAQYAGTVSWAPGDKPFAALTAYTATITLTAKPGFTLTGVGANFFTVAGATATNEANSGVVKAVFPATAKVPDIEIAFQGTIQSGGTFASANTTALTLSFNVDPTFLTAEHITLTGATKGALSGTGLTRTLAISNVTVMNGATVSVTIACPAGSVPAGYAFAGATQTARVYRPTYIGMEFQGGKIGYILQAGDPGYDANVSHGLIVGRYSESVNYFWCKPAYYSTFLSGTGTAIGTGRANTERIIAQNGPGTDYAAGVARAYTGGGYTDWYLPSKDELVAILTNKTTIDSGLTSWLNCYKSSSEFDATKAYIVWNDLPAYEEAKDTGRKVCAVRDF